MEDDEPRHQRSSSVSLDVETRAKVLESEGQPRHCLVCYTNLELTTKTPCDHNEICGICHLRLRFLHKDRKCPICKAENEHVIVDEANERRFADYPIWGNDLGADFVYRDDAGMFFPTEYFEREIQPLFGYHCTETNCDYDGTQPEILKSDGTRQATSPLRGLQEHLRLQHRLALCQLCVDNERDFVARLPRLTPAMLKKHLSQGDGPSSGFDGHPLCEFCRPKRLYDITALHQHLAKEHYKCHVCEKAGLDNQYFKNYRSLEQHFDRQHFLCHDVQCLQARFVVFGSELDLRHHERQVHGGTSNEGGKIQLEFRVRRAHGGGAEEDQTLPDEADFNYGLDGQAFVPAALPRNNNLALHPRHVERTEELRQQAARLRSSVSSENNFPTLGEANEAAQQQVRLPMGWTEGSTLHRVRPSAAVGQVTEEAFPSLPAAAPKPKLTARLMTQSPARATAGRGGGWSAGAVAAPPVARATAPTPFLSSSTPAAGRINNSANLSADNFPSLAGPSQPRATYTAAHALAKNKSPNLSADNFPSLGGGQPKYPSAEALTQKMQAPSINSAEDFPAPPTSASTQPNFRQRMVAGTAPSRPHAGSANILQAKQAAKSKATVEDMKATLGSARYKKLKNYTKEFAMGELAPDAYIDHAAALFDQGYADPDFWNFLPALLESCPDQVAADQATRYMENLKKMRNGALNAESMAQSRSTPAAAAAAPAPSGQWSALSNSNVAFPPPPAHATAPPAPRYVPPPPSPAARPHVVPGKVKNAWGGAGGASTVVRAKAPPGSVAAAAAAAKPSTGTATKFMAKEMKQEKQQEAFVAAGGKKNKKKKKQNNELRSLAFGS